MSSLRRFALALPAVLGSLTLLAAAGAAATPQSGAHSDPGLVEVVVTLPRPPLAEAIRLDRGLAARTTSRHRLDLRAPASVSYLRTLASAQRRLEGRIRATIPTAEVHWRYRVVLDGLAVVVPRAQLARLDEIPGATVWPSVTYHSLLSRTPALIGAPAVWGPTLATAGNGMKIAILDDGLDQTHIFFDPSGFSYPPGFPRGNTAYTTPKVIVAKTFAPKTPKWKYANTPFDPKYSDHATNVAGIAAGDHDTLAVVGGTRVRVSGIAPNAYLGNYKVLTTPTEDFGLDGNSPEIARGIEEAVKDGMDVINLSLGEPEIEPSRDIVVQAIDNAADAGVVSVVAAGNDYSDARAGSIGSPGTAPQAITVAASTEGDSGPADVIAGFSSGGPTPLSLQLKPDVTAPGVDLLSSLPHNEWSNHDWSGTSMAAPHVAGAAAILKERHPSWTPAEIKSALESTGAPVHPAGSATELGPLREGGGRIDLPHADAPLIFTDPSALSFGLVGRGSTATRQLALADAGGGAAPWNVSIDPQTTPGGASLSLSAATASAGTTLGVTLEVAPDAAEGDGQGFILLTRASDVRRVPYWLHVEAPKLGTEKHVALSHPGVYGGDTAGKPALVSSYRYPEGGFGVRTNLPGPEEVFRYVLKRPATNLGAVVTSHARGVRVSPRLVVGEDENRLVGYTALPVDINPYADFGRLAPAVGALFPAPAAYDFVFDTPSVGKPGKFTFRVWVDDVKPPAVRLLTHVVPVNGTIRLRVTDRGSGVDPASLALIVDSRRRSFVFRSGLLTAAPGGLSRGAHSLTLVAADYQETKNMENAGPVLPNTRTFRTTIVVR